MFDSSSIVLLTQFEMYFFEAKISISSIYAYFSSLTNRLLPVGIVIYRLIYTCKASWVQTAQQRRRLHFIIIGGITALSTCLTLFSFVYRDKYYIYLKCAGRADEFFTERKGPVRVWWILPLHHPFLILSISAFFSYIFIVPIGYLTIFVFRRKHDATLQGLTERSRLARKSRNLVTTRYNLIIWICEVLSGLVVFIPGSNLFLILYHSLPATLSPILYFMGIEDNRKAMKARIKEMIMEMKVKGIKTSLGSNKLRM